MSWSKQRQHTLLHVHLSAEVEHRRFTLAAAFAMLEDVLRTRQQDCVERESDPEAYQQLAVVDTLHVGVLDGRAAAPLDQPRRLLHELPDALLYQCDAG